MSSPSGVSPTLTRGDPLSLFEAESQQAAPPSTLQVLAHLFPPPTLGQIFVERFIQCASGERCILPDLGKEDLVVCTKSIATLAEALGLSYDTTQKYVVLFKALGILQKRTCMGQLAFILSLGIYHAPQTLEANLDYLLQSLLKTNRSKFYRLVVEVKQRCFVYGLISQEFTRALSQLHTLVNAPPGETKRRLEQRLAQAHTLMGLLMTQVHNTRLSHPHTQVDSVHTLLPNHSHASLVGPSERECLALCESTQSKGYEGALPQREKLPVREEQQHGSSASSQTGSIGRFQQREETANLPLRGAKVDSHIQLHTSASTAVPVQGRWHDEHLRSGLPALLQQVDSRHHPQELPSTHSDHRGEFTGKQEGENLSQEPSGVDSHTPLRNVNVIVITEFFLTFTLRDPRSVAEFLAEQLEQDRRVYPKYQKLLSIQEGVPRSPQTLVAAFLCTKVRILRDGWTLHHPGGFFTARCREFDAGIPQEVQAWVEQYGSLSAASLLETLPAQGLAGRATKGAAVSLSSVAKPAPLPLHPPLTLTRGTQVDHAHMVMSKSEAGTLMQRIAQDHRTGLLHTARLRHAATSRYAVLVDATTPGGASHQIVVYSAQEWERRLQTMGTWRDLFVPLHPTQGSTGKEEHDQ